MIKTEILNCTKCDKVLCIYDEIFNCKNCHKLGICNMCYITGFPYPNICLECEKKRRENWNIIKKNKLDIQKKIYKEYMDKLNSNLYSKKKV